MNEEHYAKLKEGVEAWNKWRHENPEVIPDLSEAYLREWDLAGYNLCKADLSKTELISADLKKARLCGADLSQAKLFEATLDDADLTEANLGGADLNLSRMRKAKLIKAELRFATLCHADLTEAILAEADLTEADLSNARLGKVNLVASCLKDAVLDGATLHEARLDNAVLEGAILSKAYLTNANLCEAKLKGAILSKTHLESARLERADLTGADLTGALAMKATFNGANLTGAVLKDAHLDRADLRNTVGPKFDGNHITETHFSPGAKDPWSILRRTYSGPRYALHLIFLIAFLIPYIAKSLMWVGVTNTQQAMIDLQDTIQETAEAVADSTYQPLAVALETAAERLAVYVPSEETGWKQYRVAQLLVGWDKNWLQVALVFVLLLYNALRGFLTFKVSLLREEEERSHYAPALSDYWRLYQAHWVVRVLLYVAAASFAYHAWHWLSQEVWLPPWL